MEKGLSEKDKEKRKRILIISSIILLLIIILLLFFLFNKETYEVTFDSNGGSQIETVKVKENDKVEKPDDPIKDGFVFAGWYYLDELYDFDKPVKENMTLKAEWAEEKNAEIEGIELNVTELTLAPDGIATIIATLLPENAKQVKLIWTSSDESIVTVDENGNIKALREGTVTITVATEDGEYTASCTVIVTKDAVEEVNEATQTTTAKTNGNNNNNNPSNPQSSNPETNNPQPSNPEPSSPEPNNPEPSNPETNNPQPSNPQPNNPEPSKPKYVVTVTPLITALGGINQYELNSVTKDGSSFEFNYISLGGARIKATNKTIPSSLLNNGSLKSLTIVLKDGTSVTATIVYNTAKNVDK